MAKRKMKLVPGNWDKLSQCERATMAVAHILCEDVGDISGVSYVVGAYSGGSFRFTVRDVRINYDLMRWLSNLFLTTKIDVDTEHHSGCATCDYGAYDEVSFEVSCIPPSWHNMTWQTIVNIADRE